MADAIAANKSAYAQLSDKSAVVPLRTHIPIGEGGTTLVMPAYIPQQDALGVKIVSVFGDNIKRGLPIIHAVVLALDPETGQPLALMDGGSLTAIRTGAGAGAATDVLARSDSEVVAIIGSGVQARTQLEAVCTVRIIKEARVYSPTRAHAEAFANDVRGRDPFPDIIIVTDDPDSAVRDADIICAATTSSRPVFDGSLLKPGAHVNTVGSYLPTMQEVDVTTIKRSLVTVDSREAVLAEAGDLIIPLNNGDIDESVIHAEIGEIINGTKPGRTSPEQITYFKSVGVAVQDAASAQIALANAARLNLGTTVALG